jgi:quercetin dioxygenase-like cupin family protein
MAVRTEIPLLSELQLTDRGILSETILKNKHTALVVMDLAPGEELNEHTSKFPVWIQTMAGEGILKTTGGDHKLLPGTWVFLEPSEEHAVYPIGEGTLRIVLIIMKCA